MTAPQLVAAQDAVIFDEPGRRARLARGDGGDPMPRVHALAGYGLGAALSITALVRLPGSHPSCQPSAEPKFRCVIVAVWHSRASAKPLIGLFDGRTQRRTATRWHGGRVSSSERSLRAKCQTHMVCRVRAGSFAPGQAIGAATERKLTALTKTRTVTSTFSNEERSDEVSPADTRAPEKPLNVVAGWIGTATFERSAALSARECSERHAGRDFRQSVMAGRCEGGKGASMSVGVRARP